MQPDRPAQSTLAFHASRIVIDVGVLIAMASLSMTFVIAPAGNRSALDADALPAVLLLLPIFIVTLIPDHTRPLHPALGWLSLVLALAAVPYAFVKMLDASVLADTLDGSVGFGSRLLLVGCLVTLVGVGIGLVRDLMGWPSGGTPGRSTTYRSKRRPSGGPQPARTLDSPAPDAETDQAPTRVLDRAPTDDAPTVEVDEPAPGEEETEEVAAPAEAPMAEQEDDEEPEAADEPAGGAQGEAQRQVGGAATRQRPTNFSPPEPEIVFPDTEAVAEAPGPDEDDYDHLLDTAERADAALTDHLSSMFDEADASDPAEDDA